MKCVCEREVIAIGCDGIPYLLGSRVVQNYLDCPECNISFTKLSIFENHFKTEHHGISVDVEKYRKFKNVLIPGLGHYEINYFKDFFLNCCGQWF
jgi:hypothetical protein